jgi:hypothetical protein
MVETFRRRQPQLGALALFMFVGGEISEALRVQWDDVDFKTKIVVIRKTKISEGRIANLPAALIAALANIPKIQGRPVFLYRNRSDCYRVWDNAVKRAGLKRLTFHSGRHGFATTALRSGIDPKTGAWLGGWKSIRHFMETYAHAIEDITLNERLLGVVDTPMTQPTKANAGKPYKTGTNELAGSSGEGRGRFGGPPDAPGQSSCRDRDRARKADIDMYAYDMYALMSGKCTVIRRNAVTAWKANHHPHRD